MRTTGSASCGTRCTPATDHKPPQGISAPTSRSRWSSSRSASEAPRTPGRGHDAPPRPPHDVARPDPRSGGPTDRRWQLECGGQCPVGGLEPAGMPPAASAVAAVDRPCPDDPFWLAGAPGCVRRSRLQARRGVRLRRQSACCARQEAAPRSPSARFRRTRDGDDGHDGRGGYRSGPAWGRRSGLFGDPVRRISLRASV